MARSSPSRPSRCRGAEPERNKGIGKLPSMATTTPSDQRTKEEYLKLHRWMWIPKAAGIAYAAKLKGENAVTLCTFGDGATSQGEFHEGVNFAAVHKLTIVFVCENNSYAISVPIRLQMANPNVTDRAAGYGIAGITVDGTDVPACL